MGLFYSLLSYLYPTPNKISAQKITISTQLLSQGLKVKMQKLQKHNLELQNQFIALINKPNRDRFIQNVKIDQMIIASIKFGVFEQLFYCSQKIKQEAHLISTDFSKVSDQCLKAIYSVVHLYQDFQLSQIIDLKQFIPQPYPVIGVQKLQNNIRKFLQYKKPTQYQRNLYVLQMIKRHQGKVSIMQLNKVNHGFSQNPEIPENLNGVVSADLYARSASVQINEQNIKDYIA